MSVKSKQWTQWIRILAIFLLLLSPLFSVLVSMKATYAAEVETTAIKWQDIKPEKEITVGSQIQGTLQFQSTAPKIELTVDANPLLALDENNLNQLQKQGLITDYKQNKAKNDVLTIVPKANQQYEIPLVFNSQKNGTATVTGKINQEAIPEWSIKINGTENTTSTTSDKSASTTNTTVPSTEKAALLPGIGKMKMASVQAEAVSQDAAVPTSKGRFPKGYDPTKDGWSLITDVPIVTGSLKVSNISDLIYGFGLVEQFEGGTAGSSYEESLPNVGLKIKNREHLITSLYEAGNTSNGMLILSGLNNRINAVDIDGNISTYRKIDPVTKELSLLISFKSTYDSQPVKVYIEQHPLSQISSVDTFYTIVNEGKTTFTQMALASSYDTQMEGQDDVPIFYIGNNQGVYIDTSDAQAGKSGYRLNYTFPKYQNLNWSGGKWLGLGTGSYREDAFFDPATTLFSNIDSTGDEALNGKAGTKVKLGQGVDPFDSAIHFKQPKHDLAPGESTTMEHIVGIQDLSDVAPHITLDQKDQKYDGTTDFKISGKWRDNDSSTVDLYYQIDDGPFKLMQKDAPNTNLALENDWQFTIPKAELAGKNRKITVKAVDPDKHESNMPSVNLSYEKMITNMTVTAFQNNKEISTAQTKSTIHYQVKIPKDTTLTGNYIDLDLKVPVDANLENIQNITFKNEDGLNLGLTRINPTDGNIEAAIGKDIHTPLNKDILLEYDATVKETAAKDSIISTQGKIISGSTDAYSILPSTSNTNQVKVTTGELKFVQSPTKLDFGEQTISNHAKTYLVQTATAIDNLEVQDNRPDSTGWNMTAKLNQEFTNVEKNKTLANALFYHKDGTNIPINSTDAAMIEPNGKKDETKNTLIPVKSTTDVASGLQLKVPGGYAYAGEYTTTITWTLTDGPAVTGTGGNK